MENSGSDNPVDNSILDLKESPPAVEEEGKSVTILEGNKEENETATSDEIVTFDELIKFDDEREDAALELLGGSLDSVCTYSEGYKSRQPLYSCKTCFAETGKLAGICYACSENCHDGHDLVELYTKRRFCCDCGNSKFETKCKLFEEKETSNKRNIYNDNFKGIFCSCKKPYPPDENDPNASKEDMFQCCMCEDWFHPSHIFPPDQQFNDEEAEKMCSDDVESLICKDCLSKYSFLTLYSNAKGPAEEFCSSSQNKNNEDGNELCKLEAMRKEKPSDNGESNVESVWTLVGWREELCRCNKCMNLYEDLDCTFLLEPEDSILHFVQQNRAKAAQTDETKDIYQLFVEETKEHETALKMLVGIEQMKDHCRKFFEKRAAEKRGPITGEDVEQCFAELRAKRIKLAEESQQNDGHLSNSADGPWTQ